MQAAKIHHLFETIKGLLLFSYAMASNFHISKIPSSSVVNCTSATVLPSLADKWNCSDNYLKNTSADKEL